MAPPIYIDLTGDAGSSTSKVSQFPSPVPSATSAPTRATSLTRIPAAAPAPAAATLPASNPIHSGVRNLRASASTGSEMYADHLIQLLREKKQISHLIRWLEHDKFTGLNIVPRPASQRQLLPRGTAHGPVPMQLERELQAPVSVPPIDHYLVQGSATPSIKPNPKLPPRSSKKHSQEPLMTAFDPDLVPGREWYKDSEVNDNDEQCSVNGAYVPMGSVGPTTQQMRAKLQGSSDFAAASCISGKKRKLQLDEAGFSIEFPPSKMPKKGTSFTEDHIASRMISQQFAAQARRHSAPSQNRGTYILNGRVQNFTSGCKNCSIVFPSAGGILSTNDGTESRSWTYAPNARVDLLSSSSESEPPSSRPAGIKQDPPLSLSPALWGEASPTPRFNQESSLAPTLKQDSRCTNVRDDAWTPPHIKQEDIGSPQIQRWSEHSHVPTLQGNTPPPSSFKREPSSSPAVKREPSSKPPIKLLLKPGSRYNPHIGLSQPTYSYSKVFGRELANPQLAPAYRPSWMYTPDQGVYEPLLPGGRPLKQEGQL